MAIADNRIDTLADKENRRSIYYVYQVDLS